MPKKTHKMPNGKMMSDKDMEREMYGKGKKKTKRTRSGTQRKK